MDVNILDVFVKLVISVAAPSVAGKVRLWVGGSDSVVITLVGGCVRVPCDPSFVINIQSDRTVQPQKQSALPPPALWQVVRELCKWARDFAARYKTALGLFSTSNLAFIGRRAPAGRGISM